MIFQALQYTLSLKNFRFYVKPFQARAFNETPINARKCNAILCKLLYLLQHGETISRTEATDTFFAITKLWQSKDATLRRLVYLAIKDLCNVADDVIIVTSR